ncbi:MAG: hypothetical protein ACJAR2_003748, partial [Ilumatobacter sp.]
MKTLMRPLAAISTLAAISLVVSTAVAVSPAPGDADVFGNSVFAATYVSTGASANINGDVVSGTYLTTGASSTITGNTESGGIATLGAGATVSGTVVSPGTVFGASASAGIGATSLITPADGAAQLKAAQSDLNDLDTDFAQVLGDVPTGITYTSGVYDITGLRTYTADTTIVLDADNTSDDFVFNVSDYITFGAGVKVVMENLPDSGPVPQVFWNAANYISIGAYAEILGTVIAQHYVSTGAYSTVNGPSGECGGAVYSQSSYVSVGANASVGGAGGPCQAISSPNITAEKNVVSGPTYDSGTDSYSISYDVVVTNTGGPGTYDVSENPTFGEGTTITSVTLDDALLALPIVNPVINDAAIAADQTETHEVTVVFTVAAGTATEQRDCTLGNGPGTGTLNSVTVTPNIGVPSSDDACTSISSPNITAEKNVVSGPTYDSGTDSYSISYEIDVENNGSGPGTYDVSENPTFGEGTTITSVTLDDALLALPIVNPVINDAAIAAGQIETHEVTVVFTVAAGTATE